MEPAIAKSVRPPHWLHWCSVLTVCAAVPLLTLGAFVTSMGVGMADQRGLVNPVQAISEFSSGDQSLGWKVEHSHRLAAWLVGLGGIVMAVGSWRADPRFSGKVVAMMALTLIGIQALLGKYRVDLNAWWGHELAWIHGCFAQVVFAVLVSAALLNSSNWLGAGTQTAGARKRGWSLVCMALVFVQLVLGGMVRHMNNLVTARLHLLTAFAVMAALFWLAKLAWDEKKGFPGSIKLLMGLLVLQILLGVEAWMPWTQRFFDLSAAGRESTAVLWVRSLHYLLGTLIFADTVVIALKAHRGVTLIVPVSEMPAARLGETA
jgi:heme A synthase